MPSLPSPTTRSTSVTPTSVASVTTNSSAGVVTIGARSFGTDFVSGRNRVPRAAAGISALDTRAGLIARAYPGQNQRGSSHGEPHGEKGRLRGERCVAPRAPPLAELERARAAV